MTQDTHKRPFPEYLWIGVLAAGIVIRLLDGWHIPLFMDEAPILYNVAHFLRHKTIVPAHFSYPTFFSYLAAIPVITGFFIFYIHSGFPLAGLTNSQWTGFLFTASLGYSVMAGRILSIIFSVLTMVLVYRYARKRFGLTAGLTAILILSLDMAGGTYVVYSRYALPDVASAFWATLGMILIFSYSERKSIRYLYGAALAVGLGISTKYNAGMAVLPLALAAWWAVRDGQWKQGITVLLLTAAGFLAGSPGWILKPDSFLAGYLFEAHHMARGHLGGHSMDWLWFFQDLWHTRTIILPVLAATVLYSFRKHRRIDILFLVLALPSFLVIGQFEKKGIHYMFFLYPVAALFVGRFVQALRNRTGERRYARLLFTAAVAVFFFIQPLIRISGMVRRDLIRDNREKALSWMPEHMATGSRVTIDPLVMSGVWDQGDVQELKQSFRAAGNPYLDHLNRFFENKPVYWLRDIRTVWEDAAALDTLNSDYLVAFSSNYQRFFTDNPRHMPPAGTPLYDEFMRKKRFYVYLLNGTEHGFRRIKTFDGKAGPEIHIFRLVSRNRNDAAS